MVVVTARKSIIRRFIFSTLNILFLPQTLDLKKISAPQMTEFSVQVSFDFWL